MKIQRARETANFTVLGNEFIDDKRLSVLAVGLGLILLRMPPDASITLADIAANRAEGVKALRRAAAELEAAGYLIRTIVRGEGGRFITITEMYSHPVAPEDRPASLPKPWSKAKPPPGPSDDVSAGQTESPSRNFGQGNFGERKVGDRHSSISTSGIREGEERDARARELDSPVDGDRPETGGGGLTGQRRYAGVSPASRDLIASITRDVLTEHEGITDDEWTMLSALADAVRPVVDAHHGVSWDEYEAWLRQGWLHADGRRAFTTFVGALRWRLQAERVGREAWQWAAEQRGAQDGSGPRGGQGQDDDPFGGPQGSTGTCARHGTTITDDHRCLLCEAEAAADATTCRRHRRQLDADGTCAACVWDDITVTPSAAEIPPPATATDEDGQDGGDPEPTLEQVRKSLDGTAGDDGQDAPRGRAPGRVGQIADAMRADLARQRATGTTWAPASG